MMRSRTKNSFYQITYRRIIAVVVVVAILFCIKLVAQKGLARVSYLVGMPVMKAENVLVAGTLSLKNIFTPKEQLDIANQQLRSRVEELQAQLSDYQIVKAENEQFKHFTQTKNIFATVIKKPPFTPYDYIIISFPTTDIVAVNDAVYAYSDTADQIHIIGTVSDIFSGGATVKLFSTPDASMIVHVGEKKIELTAVGAGTGLLNITASKSAPIKEGDAVTTPEGYVIGKILKVEQSTERAYTSAIVSLDINIQELSVVSIGHGNTH